MILILEGALKCNRNCKYCYQKILHGEGTLDYNKEAIAKTVKFLYKTYKDEIVLHGGEPLLLPLQDIEYFLKLSYELSGKSSICTSGLLINENHIKLFKKYNTSVSVSIDGFAEQNILRASKEETERTLQNISILADEDIPVCVMMVAHKLNYNYIFDFIIKMSKTVKFFKINHESLTPYSITPETLFLLWKKLAKLQMLPVGISIEPINTFIFNLLNNTNSECYTSLCDFNCTERAKRVMPNGEVYNCSVLPIQTLYSFKPSYKRYYILERTECKGCKFWNYCYGGCAAYYYHKDKYCYAFYKIYEFLANILHINCRFRQLFPGGWNESSIQYCSIQS